MSPNPTYLRLRFERHRHGWRQDDVADHPAIRAARPRLRADQVGEIERGIRNPTPSQLEALGQVFGIAPASVLLKPVAAIVDPDEQPTQSSDAPMEMVGAR